jgi:hypothetical protein
LDEGVVQLQSQRVILAELAAVPVATGAILGIRWTESTMWIHVAADSRCVRHPRWIFCWRTDCQ